VAVVALAGLVAGGLAAFGVFGATHVARQGSATPSVTAIGASPGALMYVRMPNFHDEQYATVAGWLRGHRLTGRISWDNHTGLPPGTVVSVSPSGRVPAGSTVTVTVAWNSDAPPPTAVASGRPAGGPGRDASPVSDSPAAAGDGSAQQGAATLPGAGSSPGASATAPPATRQATSAPPSGSPGTGATPTPTPSCVVPMGPVCF
jgi:beta-lactam-binding protein with PASTA domain